MANSNAYDLERFQPREPRLVALKDNKKVVENKRKRAVRQARLNVVAYLGVAVLVMGMVAIKKLDSVNSAKWYGKANTVILYAAMVLFIIFPKMDNVISSAIVIVCAVSLVLSLGLYIHFYHRLFINSAAENSKQTADSLNN